MFCGNKTRSFCMKVIALIFAVCILLYPASELFPGSHRVSANNDGTAVPAKDDSAASSVKVKAIGDNDSGDQDSSYEGISGVARAVDEIIPTAGFTVDEELVRASMKSADQKALAESYMQEIKDRLTNQKSARPVSGTKKALSKTKSPARSASPKRSGTRVLYDNWEEYAYLGYDKSDKVDNYDTTYSADILRSGDTAHRIYRTDDFNVKYMVSLTTKMEIDTGNAVMVLPAELFKDRRGNSITIRDEDGIALPMYSENPEKNTQTDPLYIVEPDSIVPSSRTQFGYYIDHDEDGNDIYVIVNYDKVKPGTSWFEVVYDEINVFDVADGVKDGEAQEDASSWSVQPEMDVQYKHEQTMWVYTGYRPGLDAIDESLIPIRDRWDEYLAGQPQGTEDILCFADQDKTYYAKEDMDNLVLYYCYKNDQGEEVIAYKWDFGSDKYYKNNDGQMVECLETEAPKTAVTVATLCKKTFSDHTERFYCLYSSAVVDGVKCELLTYYNENGDPAYQERTANGETTYYYYNGNIWEHNQNVKSQIPEYDWAYTNFHKVSEPVTGVIDTKAELDKVTKKTGAVTANVTGDLNTEGQVLSFIPEDQRQNANIDLENNIYTLWEIEVSGDNCTQPFSLYLDECLSYYNRQPVYSDGSALTYTYYDSATGMIVSNASDSGSKVLYNARIVGVAGTQRNDIPLNGEEVYISPYEQNSDGKWYIGSSDPAYSADELNKGLNNVRESGSYKKKVYVVAEYPKGVFPAEGVVSDQQDGVCIDTLEEANDGKLVYIPAGAVMTGNNGEVYDLLALLGAAPNKGALVSRSQLKPIIEQILDTELGSSTATGISPLMEGFIDQLTEDLPQTNELGPILSSMTTEEIRTYILESWKNPGDDRDRQQIKKACDDYRNEVLDMELERLKVDLAGGGQTTLKSYNSKKLYREVKNEANVVLDPIDGLDSSIIKDSQASHHRIERDPEVQNKFTVSKSARGSKKGWLDMYDVTDSELFDSMFTFDVRSTSTSFSETHPKSFAYFYDNSSFVHLVTADDIITAEPAGVTSSGSGIYGGSCILGPDDYCYASARIIVNESVYNVLEDTTSYGATALDENALINNPQSNTDRDWHIYVSYGYDDSGKTLWEEYAVITMDDYISDPENYGNDKAGNNVRMLNFLEDTRQPFRIKVEHNTIDHTSSVRMQITAAVKKDSPKLSSPDFGEHPYSLRNRLYESGDSTYTSFNSDASKVDTFKLRLRNYAGLYARKYYLTKDDNDNIECHEDKLLIDGINSKYDLINRDKAASNPDIPDSDKLTDETCISGEAFSLEGHEEQIKRVSGYVDVSKLEKDARAEKTSQLTNDLTHGRAHLTYKIAGFEGYQIDSTYKNNIETITSNYDYPIPGKDRKKIYIYDLLPPGVEFEGYSGGNTKPIAGFVTDNTAISDERGWITKDENGNDLIGVSVDIVSEDSSEWATWGGANGGRYLVRFTLTLPENVEDYAFADGGNWFFGCGLSFTANVSWERYPSAKNVPNLAVYVTDSETLGKQDSQVYRDDGVQVPQASLHGLEDIYSPFRNSNQDPNKTDFDLNDNTPIDTYNRLYARSMDLGDIARSSSMGIGKQVRANSDTFALYSERAAVIKGDEYTYNINVENQNTNAVSGVVLYDKLEAVESTSTTWRGKFLEADTSMLVMNGITPKLWYHDGASPSVPLTYPSEESGYEITLPSDQQWREAGWSENPRENVTAVAVELFDSDGVTPYVLEGRQMLSYKLVMKAPTVVPESDPVGGIVYDKKYTVNRSNYCYYKVTHSADDPNMWVADTSDNRYYDEAGNKTVVTLGERRIMKIAKHIDTKFTDIEAIDDIEFTFRLTRRSAYYDGNNFIEGDVPCANIQYRLYKCTFTPYDHLDKILDEVEPGIIHTTDENGQFILHDGECAVFKYVPSTRLKPTEGADEYDFDNYKVTELSKPYWYAFKTIGEHIEGWYYGDGLNNIIEEPNPPEDPYSDKTKEYFKDKCVTTTNTFRPVLYIAKNTSGVPSDMPTDPDSPSADPSLTRKENFERFDCQLELFEYPLNRLTGEYFGNDDGYSVSDDTDHDGSLTLGDGRKVKAAWVRFREYYDKMDDLKASVNARSDSLQGEIDDLSMEDDALLIEEKRREKRAWDNLKTSLEKDKAIFDRHIQLAGGIDKFFAPPLLENENSDWEGDGYLLWMVSNRLIMPITGFAEDSSDPTVKCFRNKVSDKEYSMDPRRDGGYLYTYRVGSEADIYDTPEGWRYWEAAYQDNREEIVISPEPADHETEPIGKTITFKMKANQIIALPIFIDGGMMFSNFGISLNDEGEQFYDETYDKNYLARYCYRFREDMDDKYWDDIDGEYKTVPNNPDTDMRSWNVRIPSENKPYRNTLGVLGENIANYDNTFRFKDIWLRKIVEPSDHVPKNNEKNSVDSTAFIYRLRRKAVPETEILPIPVSLCKKMTWELWTRDGSGKLIKCLMTGPVSDDGYVLAPIANYVGAEQRYTIKIRYAEVGYVYYLDEVLDPAEIFGSEPANEEAFFEARFPFVDFDPSSRTMTYKYSDEDTEYRGEQRVYYSHFCTDYNSTPDPDDDSFRLKGKPFTIATNELYAASPAETSGDLQTVDSETIRPDEAKVDMIIENVYKLRDLTVTKSIIARYIDDNMKFTVRIRRLKSNGTGYAPFTPSALHFYRISGGNKIYLTDEEINELQETTLGSNFMPELKSENGYQYMEFNLRNGIYAYFEDIGNEYDVFQIREKDWPEEEADYIHLDPVAGPNGWSQWKNVILGDNTTAIVRNGDEGYMIASKDYISDGAGDYDEFARGYLEGGDHNITLEFGIREKNSSEGYYTPTSIPDGYVSVGGEDVNNLSKITLCGGEYVVINLKGLCSYLQIPYDNAEYRFIETIPEDVQYFCDEVADQLYSVAQYTRSEELTGDKDKTSVEIQNKVTQYAYRIYKRIGGRDTPEKPQGNLVLRLFDGGGNGRQSGVKWIATGEHFDRETAQHGITDEDGQLRITAFDGWIHPDDYNLTYFAKLYFNKQTECNLIRADNAQLLEIRENLADSDPSWGYLIGYETYGEADSYVSQVSLENKDQWRRKQDTLVNTTERMTDKKLEVRKVVKPRGSELTDEDRNTEFTFTVKQLVMGVYKDAPAIRYTIDGGTQVFTTDERGSFTLKHGQTAELELPLYSYWEITETGKGTYILVIDENGEIVYDANNNYILDPEDGLAPNRTAAEQYNAQRAQSGFTLNTSLDIVAGVELGEPVILRRGIWDSRARSYNFIIQQYGINDMADDSVMTSRAYKDDSIYQEDQQSLQVRNVYGRTIYADMKLTQPIWTIDSSGETYDKVASFWSGDIVIPKYIYYREPTDIHRLKRHPVVGIASDAFKGSRDITSVVIPDTVRKIGAGAFEDCTALTSCTFEQDQQTREAALVAIGQNAFGNSNVTTYHIPEGVVEIGASAFKAKPLVGYDVYLPSTLTRVGAHILSAINEENEVNRLSLVEINSGINNSNGVLQSKFYSATRAPSKLFNSPDAYTRVNVLIMNGINKIETCAFSDQAERMRYTSIYVFPDAEDLVVEDCAMERTNFDKRPLLLIWRSPKVGDANNTNEDGPILASTGTYNSKADIGYVNNKGAGTTLVFTSISKTESDKIALIKSRFEIEQDENGWYYNAYGENGVYIGGTDKRVTVLFKEDLRTKTPTEIISEANVARYDINGRAEQILAAYTGRGTRSVNSVPTRSNSRTDTGVGTEGLWLLRKKNDNADD